MCKNIGTIKIGDINIFLYTSDNKYEIFLNELLEINKSKKSHFSIIFNRSLAENNVSEVFAKSVEDSFEVNESRKNVLFKNNTVICTIYAEVKSAEAFYYTYLLPCLKILMGRNGWITVHSSAVRISDDNSILLVAPSGCGKTTFSLSMIKAGYNLISDDLVFIKASKKRVSSYYRKLHVDNSIGEAIPWAKEILKNSKPYMQGRSKLNVDFRNLFGDNSYVSDLFDLPKYILLPILTHKDKSFFKKISWDIALYRLLGQSYIDLFNNNELISFINYLKLTNFVLCEFGTDMLSNNEEFVKNLIKKVL